MIIIGIAGGTGSGKTTVVKKIVEALPQGEVSVLPQDSYYKDSSHIPVEERQKINFDEPAAFDWELLISQLEDLKNGKNIEVPTYSYLTCTRQPETVPLQPRKYIEPAKKYADLIIPQGGNNTVAIKLLKEYIEGRINAHKED